MILVADGGSTKCEWAIVRRGEAQPVSRFRSEGINPFARSREEIAATLHGEVVPHTAPFAAEIEEVCFYGAGAIFDKAQLLADEIGKAAAVAKVSVWSDMVGAVRATAGDAEALVCILGTGSNSCRCKGGEVVEGVPALGYILGDEGSGAVIGRRVVGDILKGVAPQHIRRDFESAFRLSVAELLDRVYKQPAANRFLASFAPFVAERLEDEYIHGVVVGEFRRFLQRNIAQYNRPDLPLWGVGSVACHFRQPLDEAARAEGLTLAGVVQSPIGGIAAYHAGVAQSPQGENLSATEKQSPQEGGGAFVKITEQPSLYNDLECRTERELLEMINREDHRVADAVAATLPCLTAFVERLVGRMQRGGRLFYMGAGTSGRLGVLDASEVPPTFGMPPTVVIGIIAGGDRALRTPVEGAEDDTEQGWSDLSAYNITPLDTVVGIAASGTTPYVVGAIRAASRHGCLTAAITSNRHSSLAAEADFAIETVVGPEFVTGSSRMKSGTAQKLVCNMITTTAMIRLGRVRGNRMVNMQLSNSKLIDRGTRMLVDELGLDYDCARRLLLIHESVQRAVDAVNKSKMEKNR